MLPQKLCTIKLKETGPKSKKTNTFHAAQKQITFAQQKTELEDASWKKKYEVLTESFFPRCVLLFPCFLGGGGGSAFSCINSASDTNSLLCKVQHAKSESKTL